MSNFNFTSQVCTSRKQSERLLALGLKKETADCNVMLTIRGEHYYTGFDMLCYRDYCFRYGRDHNYQPAWSLHRLLCLLPTEYIPDIDFQYIMQDFIFRSQDMYEEVISCIETLIKEGYFNKEYLEE